MIRYLKILINLIKINFFPNLIFNNASYIGKDYFLKIQKKIANEEYPEIDSFLKKKQFNDISNEWINELALRTQIVIKKSKINIQHGRILYGITDHICKKSQNINILETGTARGFSSLCMSKALNDNNKLGKIFTIDFLPNDKKMYWNCISDFEGKLTRQELLKDYSIELKNISFIQGFSKKILPKIDLPSIDLAFLDGSHKYKDVKIEYEYVKKIQKKGDIIFFDDYTPGKFDGILNLIEEIKKTEIYTLEEIFSSKERGYILATKN